MSFQKTGKKLDRKIKATKKSYKRGKKNADSKSKTQARGGLKAGLLGGAIGATTGVTVGGLSTSVLAGAAIGASEKRKGASRRRKLGYKAGRAATAIGKAKKGAYKMTEAHKKAISKALKGRKRR